MNLRNRVRKAEPLAAVGKAEQALAAEERVKRISYLLSYTWSDPDTLRRQERLRELLQKYQAGREAAERQGATP
jgi:hypothetical protein